MLNRRWHRYNFIADSHFLQTKPSVFVTQVILLKNAQGVFNVKNRTFLRGNGNLWYGITTHQETLWKSGFYVWNFLKERPKRSLAEVRCSHQAMVILDLIMFPYPTRSKISDILKKGLFFCAVLGLLAFRVISIKILLGILGTKKNE